MILRAEVVGVPEAAEGITDGFSRMQIACYRQMEIEMNELRNYTVRTHMSGPTGATTIQQRSGHLARSLTSEVRESANQVDGIVGVPMGGPPYARILELGGTTRAHVIRARNAQFLAFEANNSNYTPWGMGALGGMVYRRKVNHPGSHFPPRPYLLTSFNEQVEQIKDNLSAAMKEARP